MLYFKERGWIANGIDINTTFKDTSIINADFEKYDKFKDVYNLIWMGHVFEHFSEPLLALEKAYNLMDKSEMVALKVLREELFENESSRKRFKQEASIAFPRRIHSISPFVPIATSFVVRFEY